MAPPFHFFIPTKYTERPLPMDESCDLVVLQKLVSEDGQQLARLSTHPCLHNLYERHILWSDIKHHFPNIDHLATTNGTLVLYMLGPESRPYVGQI